ncbi:SDR family oxidoreductase [Sinorhizobium medicae]|uniref:Short-chain dehydrogenase/reductase SDR n=2 Tax=Sinorhizobium medicae TaxID=110321 RepID=A6U7K9_SINMW|nr:SDR family oxidoreductase [Sinorhizobium medicae]ABR59639.1 short-chain dehydrogenase/reductase SDR [Sinorhizobium medicae WSM419]MBO1963077.1 SDR family oxidoreductase [Sinorhizobium medicae]MDX0404265.1 SDR family oxidoreductase [Sinorhizobium medicae]MDX0410202.1 SDR family oxidoreductase [Sinorhizobium medicae]MDX0416619.1 SDR family oxidoreductase [Sinorhizobium medicae]
MKRTLKAALVTGGARRIGRAIVEDLATHGFAVAIHANGSFAEAEALAASLRGSGAKAIALRADLTEIGAVSRLVAEATGSIGPLDLLVNNASVFNKDSIAEFDEAVWERHFALHVKAPSLLARDFAQQRQADVSGLIVNVIDQRVWSPNPRFYSYMLSKSALWTATQTMAQALAPEIRVNGIGPGPTLPNDRQDPRDFQAQVEALILRRGPALDEFGRAIRFLFDTPSITGQMIALDGGQHLAWETPDIREIVE